MAKSLRAKQKVRMRGIKRDAVFQPVVDARTQRLSEKLTKKIEEKHQEKESTEQKEEVIIEHEQIVEQNDQMEVEPKKVPSSKSKDKKKKTKNTKIKNALVFNKGSKRSRSRK